MADENPARIPVTQEETRLAFAAPAAAVNKFFIHVGPPGVRITFAELVPDTSQPFVRTAVLMHPQDAIQLKEVLAELLAPIEKQIKDAIAAEKAKQDV